MFGCACTMDRIGLTVHTGNCCSQDSGGTLQHYIRRFKFAVRIKYEKLFSRFELCQRSVSWILSTTWCCLRRLEWGARGRLLRTPKHSRCSSEWRKQTKLETLWDKLKPDVRRKGGRITKEWSEIGFQGQDPTTDFRYVCWDGPNRDKVNASVYNRSMGLLSLEQLVYFASNYS